MVKRHTTLNVEDDLLIEAKDKSLNISELTEKAIKEELNIKEVNIDTSVSKCEFCGRENLEGLTWLYPDERWICSKCLKLAGNRVPASKA
tara:strand:+ start:387 stop:656 length:270 start_codon:yes stop_codon:yes gene_type:complete